MAINDPRDIPGLVLWLSAESVTTLANNAALTTAAVRDLSGNGNHPVSVGGVGTATWEAVAPSAIGPAFYFNGSAYLTFGNILSGASAGEVMFTVKSDSGSDHGFHKFGTFGADNHYPYSGTVYDDFGSTNRQSFTPSLSINSWRRYNAWSAANDWGARLDEVVQATSASNTVSWATGVKIGNVWGGSFGHHWGGITVYNRKLTTTERADLAAWWTAHPSGGTVATATTGTLSASAPAATVSLAGQVPTTGALNVTAPAAVVSLADWTNGDLSATAPAAVMNVLGETATAGAIVATAPAAAVSLAGAVTAVAAGDLTVAAPAAQVALGGNATTTIQTDTRNDWNARIRDGLGLVTTDVAVAPLPAGLTRAVRVDKALAYPTPTMVDGRPT